MCIKCSVSLSALDRPPAGLALASGLAATVTITHMLKAGDGIVCMDDVYGGEAAPSEWVNDEKVRNEEDSNHKL